MAQRFSSQLRFRKNPRPRAEAFRFVARQQLRCDQENRLASGLRIISQTLAEVDAGHVREAEVQQDDIRVHFFTELQTFASGPGRPDVEFRVTQHFANDEPERLFIIHSEHSKRRFAAGTLLSIVRRLAAHES